MRSEENPADLLSRGTKVETLINHPLWWTGPAALRESVETWPVWNVPAAHPELDRHITTEVKTTNTRFENVLLTLVGGTEEKPKEISLLDSTSSYRKVCRVTAYVLRFCSLLYEPIRKRKGKNVPLLKECYVVDCRSNSPMTVEIGERSYEVPRVTVPERANV